jgi:hypothetical protein
MNKKVLVGLGVAAVVCIVAGASVYLYTNSEEYIARYGKTVEIEGPLGGRVVVKNSGRHSVLDRKTEGSIVPMGAGWAQYTSSEWGLTFSYPEEWKITEQEYNTYSLPEGAGVEKGLATVNAVGTENSISFTKLGKDAPTMSPSAITREYSIAGKQTKVTELTEADGKYLQSAGVCGTMMLTGGSPPQEITDKIIASVKCEGRERPVESAPEELLSTTTYKGAWFDVAHPSTFTARKEGMDEASFISPDGTVEFYVYSPQWSGDPVWYMQSQANETLESDTSTEDLNPPNTNQYGTTYYKKVFRYITFTAKDGSYKRSLVSITAGWVIKPEDTDFSSKTHLVFGITYKDKASYDKYLGDYQMFKKSLVQYAD